MFYGMGYSERDFDNPMIGIANAHSTITPCNAGLQPLADAAAVALKEYGANAQMFGTPTISDGMSMGTEGMKYSLVSREVIADCIETCVGGQWMDGVLVIGGCDKTVPALLMGFNLRGAFRIGAGMLPRGEVTLIVAGIGLSSGIIGPELFGVAVMTLFIASVFAVAILCLAGVG